MMRALLLSKGSCIGGILCVLTLTGGLGWASPPATHPTAGQ